MAELRSQLDQAQQELDSLGAASSTKPLVERCEALEKELHLSNQRLKEACDGSYITQLRAKLAHISQERDKAQKQVQELLIEGQTLTAQHQELKVQLATTKAEYESKLRVAAVELESCQKQYGREAEFALSQKSEVGRLTNDLKEASGDIKSLKAELDGYRAQTLAQYQPVPPGHQYGSPIQTGPIPLGHYSPVPRSSQLDCFTWTSEHSDWVFLRDLSPESTDLRVPTATGFSCLFEATYLFGSGNPTGSAPTGAGPFR